MNKKVDCVVVTYNRLYLLKECLEALLNQEYLLNKIYVINNNSTDETKEYLKHFSEKNSVIKPVNLRKNIGGAGGFNIGLKYFMKKSNADYVWIMDDDTIPSKMALKMMMEKIPLVSELGYLCSNVKWRDNSIARMNVPQTEEDWNEKADKGLIKVKSASFVSILFPREVIKKVGYPITDFFIWGDDVEYTLRITKHNLNGYLVANSIVEHKIKNNIATNIILEKDINRVGRYYYANRNYIYTNKKLGTKKDLLKAYINKGVLEPIKILKNARDHKLYRLSVSIKGTVKGTTFHPKVEKYD